MTAATVPVLDVEGLRVDYPGVVAVDNLTLALRPGDACALIGPNGAGKTTTMRAICGLNEPTRGAVRIDGVRLDEDPGRFRASLGFMPDDAPVNPKLTVREFLDHFARAYNVANRDAKVEEVIAQVGLLEKSDVACQGLSRGMKQRLILAKTLLPDPKLLILDEPASGLDPISRIALRDLILTLRDQGRAILVSSHILSEIAAFCNRVAILERGRLKVFGDVDALLREGTKTRRMRLRWRAAGAHPRGVLEGHAGVSAVDADADRVEFDFAGGEDGLDALLAALVGAGVRVAEWRPMRDDLEEILLQSGAREVQ